MNATAGQYVVPRPTVIAAPTPCLRFILDSQRASQNLLRFKVSFKGHPNPGTRCVLARSHGEASDFYLQANGIAAGPDARLTCHRMPD